jgi:pimeloyl-ACP methyl ester carboxylesterase
VIIHTANGHFGIDDVGTGLPVVFLHGFPHTRALWAQQVFSLSVSVRCIAPDLRGFGESVNTGPFTMEQYARDVASVLDQLRIDQAVLVGLSMGGYIAMACMRHIPERVFALGLLDTQATADDADTRAKRDAMINLAHREGVDAVVRLLIPGMMGRSTQSLRPDLASDMARIMRSASVAGIVGALTALRDRPDSTDTMRAVAVPTLVAVGEEDVLTPTAKAQELVALLPPGTSRRFDVIAGAGHVSCFERPSAVTCVLSEFLNALQTA